MSVINIFHSFRILFAFAVISAPHFVFGAQAGQVPGVTDVEVLLGEVHDANSATNQRALYLAEGHRLYFDVLNKAGGVYGRKIKVLDYDDHYDPATTVELAKTAVEKDGVFALFGLYGTANVRALLPYLKRTKIPAFGTGNLSEMNAEDRPTVFNFKASYAEEAQAMLKTAKVLKAQKSGTRFICVYQDDAFGHDGQGAIAKGMHDLGWDAPYELMVSRKGEKVSPEKITPLKGAKDLIIFVFANEKPVMTVLKQIKDEAAANFIFMGASGLTTQNMMQFLNDNKVESFFFQPYPVLVQKDIPLVQDYLNAVKKNGGKASPPGLAGYIDAAIFTEALKLAGRQLTREALVATFESQLSDRKIGGLHVGFSKQRHQGLDHVYVSTPKGNELVPYVAPGK